MPVPPLTAPPATVYLINRSTLVTDTDAARIAAAVDTQLTRDLCPAWGLATVHLQFLPLPGGKKPPAGAPWLALLDTLDQADALGYHTEDSTGAVYGYAGAKASLENGAGVLTGPFSVASVVSHEACELAGDRHCERWADSGRGYEIAAEVCDPVQSGHYDIDGVTVSNFVTPAYFDPDAPRGSRLDYCGTLSQPYSLAPGGYYVRRQAGRAREVFGEAMPEWLRQVKRQHHTRTQHRVAQLPRR